MEDNIYNDDTYISRNNNDDDIYNELFGSEEINNSKIDEGE